MISISRTSLARLAFLSLSLAAVASSNASSTSSPASGLDAPQAQEVAMSIPPVCGIEEPMIGEAPTCGCTGPNCDEPADEIAETTPEPTDAKVPSLSILPADPLWWNVFVLLKFAVNWAMNANLFGVS